MQQTGEISGRQEGRVLTELRVDLEYTVYLGETGDMGIIRAGRFLGWEPNLEGDLLAMFENLWVREGDHWRASLYGSEFRWADKHYGFGEE